MEPSARLLCRSLLERLAGLEDFLLIFPGHGAGSACGKSLGAVPFSSLGHERRFNAALRLAMEDEDAFVREMLSGQPEPPLYFAAMKRLNRDGAPVTGGPPTVRTLTGHEAMQAAALPTTAIVDCRDDRAAFLSAHVPRSIYAPLRSSQFEMAAGSYVPESHTVLLVAENQDAASLATLRFYRMGWDGVVGWISPEAWVKSGGELVAMPRVRFEEFDAHAAAARGQLLDVRSAAEHQTERIDGAHNVAHTRLASHLPDLLPKQKLFVHCGTGRRATLAVSYLRAQGVDAVLVDGNFDARKRVPSQAPTRE